MTTEAIDQLKLDAFGEKMIAVMNNAATALMTSVGHQSGLFDAMSELPTMLRESCLPTLVDGLRSEEIVAAAKRSAEQHWVSLGQ